MTDPRRRPPLGAAIRRGGLATTVLIAAAGCAGPPPSATPETQKPAERPGRLARVSVDPRLMSSCDAAAAAATFVVDIGFIKPPEAATLVLLARCLARGPLQGRGVRLVEHVSLGWPSRDDARVDALHAYAVRDYLVFHGVQRDAIEVVTRQMPVTGEAVVADPYEPRVDVQLPP